MSAPPFQPGDRVRLVDASPAPGSKRRPAHPMDRDLIVARISGDSVEVRGVPGFWRAAVREGLMARGVSFPLLSAHRVSPDDDEDFYPTPPWAARAGGERILALDPRARSAWEPACGAGHMVHGLTDYFAVVHASDAWPYDGNRILDFTGPADGAPRADWIVTNPPFNQAEAFIRLGWERARRGLALLMKISALESVGRHGLLTCDCPLTMVMPFAERVPMHKGRWEPEGSTAAFYAWFVWLKPALRPERFMARTPDGGRVAGTWPIPPKTRDRLTRPDDAGRFGVGSRP
ncbi:hypothetical protein [Phenylobacterium sp.]|uniref:hypothetical protein n=1 Tax=Phenylobacterium sp. TaxID=1871053 RepID=UPI00301D2BA1